MCSKHLSLTFVCSSNPLFSLYSYHFPLFFIIRVFFNSSLPNRPIYWVKIDTRTTRWSVGLVCLHQIRWWHSVILLFQWLEANISKYSPLYDASGITKSPPIIQHGTNTWSTYHEIKFSPQDDPLRSHEVSSRSYSAHQHSGQLVIELSWTSSTNLSGATKSHPRCYGARKWVGHLAKVKDQASPDHTLWPLKNGAKSPYLAA
jgi:hypothetical protein